MKIQCDGCEKLCEQEGMNLIVSGENSWGFIFRKYLCNSCLDKENKRRSAEKTA